MKKKDNYKQTKWFGKPLYYFGDYLRNKYNSRVLKLPIDAGFNCPNRDGSISNGGCIFCSERGSAAHSSNSFLSIHEQMQNAVNSFSRSDPLTKYIAYFQAFTNTYAPINKLKLIYDEAVKFPNTIGLMIGTRPDCISHSIADLIQSYNLPETWIELGMQSIHNRSLKYLNRGHNHTATNNSIDLLSNYNIKTCLHVILGIPGESRQDMIDIANYISSKPVHGVKIHHLHVIKNTPLEKIYFKNNIHLQDFNSYISVLTDFIEHLRQDIIIHRISGDQDENNLIAPLWGLHKGTVQKELENSFHKRGTWQGFLTY